MASFCGFQWNTGETVDVRPHICTLKPEHDGNHYCYIWHGDNKCKDRKHVNNKQTSPE